MILEEERGEIVALKGKTPLPPSHLLLKMWRRRGPH